MPMMRSQGYAISRSTVHTIGLEVAQANPPIPQGPGGRDRMAHGRLLNIGGDDAYFAKARRDLGQGDNAGTIDAVVVRD